MVSRIQNLIGEPPRLDNSRTLLENNLSRIRKGITAGYQITFRLLSTSVPHFFISIWKLFGQKYPFYVIFYFNILCQLKLRFIK